MSKERFTVTSDFTKDFNEIVKSFKSDAVLVGIPEDKATRRSDDEEGAPINNATLLAINNFGSPMNNIPARPVMQIGIKNAQDDIAEQYKLAIRNAFAKGFSAVDTYYRRAGIIASNSIKKAINDQIDIEEPSEATLKAREAAGFKGTKALIVSAQMRNSITYVVT